MKKCCTCLHGIYEEDLTVGIFGHYECDNPGIPEDFDGEYPIEDEDGNCIFFDYPEFP